MAEKCKLEANGLRLIELHSHAEPFNNMDPGKLNGVLREHFADECYVVAWLDYKVPVCRQRALHQSLHSCELSPSVFGFFQSQHLTSLLPSEHATSYSPSPRDMLSIPQTTTAVPPSVYHLNRSWSSPSTDTQSSHVHKVHCLNWV